MGTNSVTRLKVSVFRERYFTDAGSRPSRATLLNHIKNGLLAGEQIGNLWYVRCTEWGDPLYYRTEPLEQPTHVKKTGNKLADSILANLSTATA